MSACWCYLTLSSMAGVLAAVAGGDGLVLWIDYNSRSGQLERVKEEYGRLWKRHGHNFTSMGVKKYPFRDAQRKRK